jgi:hypothetical protein
VSKNLWLFIWFSMLLLRLIYKISWLFSSTKSNRNHLRWKMESWGSTHNFEKEYVSSNRHSWIKLTERQNSQKNPKYTVRQKLSTTWLVSIISFLIMNLFQIGLPFSLPVYAYLLTCETSYWSFFNVYMTGCVKYHVYFSTFVFANESWFILCRVLSFIFYWFGMVRRKLTIPERWRDVGMHNGGFSHRRVADHVRVNHSIIVRIIIIINCRHLFPKSVIIVNITIWNIPIFVNTMTNHVVQIVLYQTIESVLGFCLCVK